MFPCKRIQKGTPRDQRHDPGTAASRAPESQHRKVYGDPAGIALNSESACQRLRCQDYPRAYPKGPMARWDRTTDLCQAPGLGPVQQEYKAPKLESGA